MLDILLLLMVGVYLWLFYSVVICNIFVGCFCIVIICLCSNWLVFGIDLGGWGLIEFLN